MLLNDSGIRLVVRAGMALCGGQEFWLVRISFTRRVRVFFCGLLLVSSLQDRGALGQRLIDHHGVGLQSRKTILLKKNRFLCPVLVASSFSSLLCSFFRFEISAQSMYRTSLHWEKWAFLYYSASFKYLCPIFVGRNGLLIKVKRERNLPWDGKVHQSNLSYPSTDSWVCTDKTYVMIHPA